ncbi:MAG: hypothetical protein KBC64_06285 [Simkaniaceae bacterium]|nr:hypothetical protein [Simkaniaceae bacterium]
MIGTLYDLVENYRVIVEVGGEIDAATFLEHGRKSPYHPLTSLALAVMRNANNDELHAAVYQVPLSTKILGVYWDLSADIRVEEWGWSEHHLGDNPLRVMKAAQIALNPLAYLQHVLTVTPGDHGRVQFALDRLNDHIPGARRAVLARGAPVTQENVEAVLGIEGSDWGAWYHALKSTQTVVRAMGKEGVWSAAGSGTPFESEPFYAVCPALSSREGPLQLGCYIIKPDGANMILPGSWSLNTRHPVSKFREIPESVSRALVPHKISTLHFHTMRHETPLEHQFSACEERPEGLGDAHRFQVFTHHSVHEGAEGRFTYDRQKWVPMGVFEAENVAPLTGDWHHPVAFNSLTPQEVYIHPVGGRCVMSPNTAGLRMVDPTREAHFYLVYVRDDGDERVNGFVIEMFVNRK